MSGVDLEFGGDVEERGRCWMETRRDVNIFRADAADVLNGFLHIENTQMLKHLPAYRELVGIVRDVDIGD